MDDEVQTAVDVSLPQSITRDHCAIGPPDPKLIDPDLTARVEALCRRSARDPRDVPDAAQEVILKLLRHYDRIDQSLEGWLSATARSVCADIARHRSREWRRRAEWAIRSIARPASSSHAQLDALRTAFDALGSTDRDLINRRYYENTKVRVIAEQLGVSTATASRRIAAAVERLGALLDVPEISIPIDTEPKIRGVRSLSHEPRHANGTPSIRPIRVGVMVSELALRTPTSEGWFIGAEGQVRSVPLLHRDSIQLAALVEPGSTSVGGIERVIRNFQLGGTVIDVTDARALYRDLDVIYLGTVIGMIPRALDAIIRAVEMGVGLLNEHFTGSNIPGMNDPRVLKLMLAERAAEHHTPGQHGLPRPAHVVKTHEIIPGMLPGTRIEVGGCGPICAMAKSANILIPRSDNPTPTHQIDKLPNGGIMPILAVGNIDGGRVAVLNQFIPEVIGDHPSYRGDFYTNVCRWLARADSSDANWMVRTPA